jgi:hypothetical protein
MNAKFEQFERKHRLNADGRRVLRFVSLLWDVALMTTLLGVCWTLIVLIWAVVSSV